MVNYSGIWAKSGRTKGKTRGLLVFALLLGLAQDRQQADNTGQVMAIVLWVRAFLCSVCFSVESFSFYNQAFDAVLQNFPLLSGNKTTAACKFRNACQKRELVPLSLDVIQDSWRWLTHKSGQVIVAIGSYASILRRKDVTIACMRPITTLAAIAIGLHETQQRKACHCHYH